MIKITIKSDCTGCAACMNVCPKKCIDMKTDSEGFFYPEVDESLCINCHLCERVCPVLNEVAFFNSKKAYGGFNNDKLIKKESSSGGIFSILANYIIENNGIVYGAKFDNDSKKIMHIGITDKTQISELRGSKYAQSDICSIYKDIRSRLNDGQLVYFSGTPCEVAGLRSYLSKSYDNLICQDIICHGVPSPIIFKDYLELLENKKSKKVDKINFRYKENEWENYKILIMFEDGSAITEKPSYNSYMRGFTQNMFLRPSCSQCHFKGASRYSDITLADFWGVRNIEPKLFDKEGVSLILVNTKKGEKLFKEISNLMTYKDVDKESALNFNKSALISSIPNKNRERFFESYNKKGIEFSFKKYCHISKYKRLYYFFRSNLKGFIYKFLKK